MAVAACQFAAQRKLVSSSGQVEHVNRLSVHDSPAGDPTASKRQRYEIHRDGTVMRHGTQVFALLQDYNYVIGGAKAASDPRNDVKHGLNVEFRVTDDGQHVASCSLIFKRFRKLLRALRKFSRSSLLGLEQPRVLDRDDGLVGEGLQQIDLSVGEREDLGASNANHTDSRACTNKRDRQDA